MALLALTEAAERLGVSTRQVQHLAARGELHLLARGVLDETSVDRYLAVRGSHHRRAWSEKTAWGAVALVSGVAPPWMGESQRSRLKGRLRSLSSAGLVERSRERAEVTRYAGHASTVTRLRAELVDTDRAARSLGLTGATPVDGYLAADDLAMVVARHGLERDVDGRFTLRATTMDLHVVSELATASTVLAALDLAESLDARESHVGLDELDDALARLRG
jgi:hypothetical protein